MTAERASVGGAESPVPVVENQMSCQRCCCGHCGGNVCRLLLAASCLGWVATEGRVLVARGSADIGVVVLICAECGVWSARR